MNNLKTVDDALDYLNVSSPAAVGWAHAANDQRKLESALENPVIHWVEGDISHGPSGAIMAHPPATTSDLTFEAWLDAIVAAKKGAKLDFKSPKVVENALAYAARKAAGHIPLMVNADLLQGPGGKRPRFDSETFLSQHRTSLPDSILSPGWVVGRDGRHFTRPMVDAMERILHDAPGPVSIPVHGLLYLTSHENLLTLLNGNDRTFTFWGRLRSEEELALLRRRSDPQRCFFDLQWEDGSQIFI